MFYRTALATGLIAAAIAPSAFAQEAAEPLTRQVFIATMDAEFSALDADGNGQVTAQEAVTAQRQAAYNQALQLNQTIFRQLDRDGSGSLSAEEFALLVNPQAIPVDPAPLLQAFDINGDGIITLVEYRTRTQANFDQIDTDRDGVVTAVEMQAAGIPAQ